MAGAGAHKGRPYGGLGVGTEEGMGPRIREDNGGEGERMGPRIREDTGGGSCIRVREGRKMGPRIREDTEGMGGRETKGWKFRREH